MEEFIAINERYWISSAALATDSYVKLAQNSLSHNTNWPQRLKILPLFYLMPLNPLKWPSNLLPPFSEAPCIPVCRNKAKRYDKFQFFITLTNATAFVIWSFVITSLCYDPEDDGGNDYSLRIYGSNADKYYFPWQGKFYYLNCFDDELLISQTWYRWRDVWRLHNPPEIHPHSCLLHRRLKRWHFFTDWETSVQVFFQET